MIFVIRRSHGWGIHEHFCRRHRREIGPAGRGQGWGAASRGPSRRADRRTETGSVVDGIYAHGASRDDIDDGKGDWAVRVLQVTSSPIKNVKKDAFVDKRWWTPGETVAANAGESTLRMDEYGPRAFPTERRSPCAQMCRRSQESSVEKRSSLRITSVSSTFRWERQHP